MYPMYPYPFLGFSADRCNNTLYQMVEIQKDIYGVNGLNGYGLEITYWLSKVEKTGKIYHEAINGGTSHRFYFSKAEQARNFREFVDTLEVSPNFRMFPLLSHAVSQTEGVALAGAVYVPSSYWTLALWLWCRKHFTGRTYRTDEILLFENVDDLAKYRLTFGTERPCPALKNMMGWDDDFS